MYVPEPAEHEMPRQTLRRFLDRECPRELVRRWDEEDHYPRATVEKLRELGVFGLTTPEEYGGAGCGTPAALITVEELARRSLTLAIAYIMGAFYGAVNVLESGSEAQKRALLPRLAAGEQTLLGAGAGDRVQLRVPVCFNSANDVMVRTGRVRARPDAASADGRP